MCMENNHTTHSSAGGIFKTMFNRLVIGIAITIGIVVYIYVLGDGSHFEANDNANHSNKGDFLGIVYKGGLIVPILI